MRSSDRIPELYGVIERPRLLKSLEAVYSHRVSLVSAPPGYGKTTLVAQFAQQSDRKVVWHTLDDRQRDISNLHDESLAAFGAVFPQILNTDMPDSRDPVELAQAITTFVRTSTRSRVLYILDNVQHIDGAPFVNHWLRTLVAQIPTRCRLILISRNLPDLPLTELIASGDLFALGQEQLRFDEGEVADLVKIRGQEEADPDTFQEIMAILEGWPAGMVMALQPLPKEVEMVMLQGRSGPEALFNALAESLIDAQPPSLREFLFAASTLERVTTVACEQALGLHDAAKRMHEIQQRGMFLASTTAGLVFHGLFRRFLQRKFSKAEPKAFCRLHKRAAEWYLNQNRHDEAFEHFIQAGLTDRAARIAEHVAQAYYAQGKTETLVNFYNALESTRTHIPELTLACALIDINHYDYDNAAKKLTAAEDSFRLRGDLTGIARVEVRRATIEVHTGYPQRAIERLTLFEDQREDIPSNLRANALRTLGIAYLHLGHIKQAVRKLTRALPLYEEFGDQHTIAILLQDLEVCYTQLGDVEQASACLQRAVALHRSIGARDGLAEALNNLGYHYHQHGDYQQARQIFQEGLQVAANGLNARVEGYLSWSLGDLLRDLGEFQEAERAYHRAIELSGRNEPYLWCATLMSLAQLLRWAGRDQEALPAAELAVEVAGQHNMPVVQLLARVSACGAQLAFEDPTMILIELQDIYTRLQAEQSKPNLLRVLGHCALAAAKASDSQAAREYLKSAVKLMRGGSGLQPLAAEIQRTPELRSLLKHDRECKVLCDAVAKLDAALTDDAHSQPVQVARGTTQTLTLKSLGDEMIVCDGQPLSNSEWRAVTARELFYYLHFMGPRTREQISLTFWPNSTPSKVRSNFHTTLHRARQALGENVIYFDGKFYAINPGLEIQCDAQELEQLVKDARCLSPHNVMAEDLWSRAVRLYHGELMPSLHSDWIGSLRTNLNELYLEALLGMARCTNARRAYNESVQWHERALVVDPYREDVYRSLMKVHAGAGQKKQVIATIERLEMLFRRELAITPSHETVTLAHNLLH